MSTSSLVTSGETLAQNQKGKMYFSNQPFGNGHEGSKNEFTSRDFIYGRIETSSQSLKDAFGMSSIKTEFYYVQAKYTIVRVEDNREKYFQGTQYIKVNNGSENGTTLNFDIFPAPDKAKTTVSLLEDFSTGQRAGVFAPFLDNSDYFWKTGEYKVALSIYLKSYSPYGSIEDPEKWPDITGEFTFKFDMNDVGALIKSSQAADELVKENSLKMDKLPDFFATPAKISDPALSNANVMAILKRDLPSVNVIKLVIPPFDGTLKDIAKNDLGLILFRYVRPYVRIIYKENGKCYLGSVSLKEDYTGGGKYGPLKLNKFWGTEGLFDCSVVK